MSKSKAEQALDFAREYMLADLASKMEPAWMAMHNALFGMGGRLMELFPTQGDRAAFAKTDEFKAIHAMIDELRQKSGGGEPDGFSELLTRANGAVSVRMPKSIHAALLLEADAEGVSLNQLCLAKLCVQLRALRPSPV